MHDDEQSTICSATTHLKLWTLFDAQTETITLSQNNFRTLGSLTIKPKQVFAPWASPLHLCQTVNMVEEAQVTPLQWATRITF